MGFFRSVWSALFGVSGSPASAGVVAEVEEHPDAAPPALPIRPKSPATVRAEALDAYVEKRLAEDNAQRFPSKVVGVTRRNDDGRSRQKIIREELNEFTKLDLVPEPENPVDRNAIAVYTEDGEQIGYLNARLAAEVCKGLAGGKCWECFVLEITGHEYGRLGVNVWMLSYDAAG